jgi:two-component system, OmpR family, phosphate regulon sensor histidine kinase PhoR
MKKQTIKIIIIFSALSLAGLIITQTFWVKRALNLAERQHDHRVDMALDEVVDELKTYRENLAQADTITKYNPKAIFTVLDTVYLRNLIEKYVEYHSLDTTYYYYIIRSKNDSIIHQSAASMPNLNGAKLHKACLHCIWKKDYFHLAIYFPEQRSSTLVEMSTWLTTSVIFLVLMILAFYYTISTIIKQKKISEIRDDLINNITHEFKTPIATISLASEVLMNANPKSAGERLKKYSAIIYEENKRMRTQVDQVLQMAVMDKREYELLRENTNIHELIKSNVENLCLEHCDKKVSVHYQLEAQNPIAFIDPVHISNVIINLVTNSIKYSNGDPEIKISSRNENNFVVSTVQDRGIGIQKENLKHIFEKFYRVPTGNVHNVKGFGIGLYYVKTMVEAHKGFVKVKSEPGKGSRFDVFLPLS